MEGTYSTQIDPWDEIDIHENGDFKVRYYVSDVSHSVPDGIITLQCQDKSKQLVDYFIPTSYTIDYPSYTRYWIELFLDEAGINYNFTTSSQGNLLSNYTQLGLSPAYDQIMTLLQMSGWFMYFDGDGIAVIGDLDVDLADPAGSLGKDDILDIKRITDDKMLRNRAVVWGQYDEFSGQNTFADVRVHTRWNYDHDDLRTMVISNSNIPNVSSAYGIANQLIKEFATATIEKHIVAWGARNFNLGEALRVDSHVWRGKGLITTFGVSMDRNGLVTNIILDERCPRLFGFFNFGDYVYVSTFGDGIWRKHIQFDPTWYDFSTGLTNLNITDMHINDGIFGSVGHSGNMYIANNETGPWFEVTVTGLPSSAESNFSGVLTDSAVEVFSGIMARATIVDKYTNNVKFGVDTYSGLNTGDYFLTYSSMFAAIISSGTVVASGTLDRGWILEYDPYTGELVGGLGSGIYPISVSGNYDIRVLDLENDGINDYVSVKQGTGFANNEFGYTLGQYNTAPLFDTYDTRAYAVDPSFVPPEERFVGSSPIVRDPQSMLFVDNGVSGERVQVTIDKSNVIHRRLFEIDIDGNATSSEISKNIAGGGTNTVCIYYVNSSVYRVITYRIFTSGTKRIEVYSLDWNVVANTTSGWTTVHTFNYGSMTPRIFSNVMSLQTTAYIVTQAGSQQVTAGGFNVNPVFSNLYTTTINLLSGSISTVVVFEFESGKTAPADSTYEYIRGDADNTAGSHDDQFIVTHLVQTGSNTCELIGWFCYGYYTITEMKEMVITGDPNGLSVTELYSDMTPRFEALGGISGDTTPNLATQLSRDKGMVVRAGGVNDGFAFNKDTFVIFTGDPSFHLQPRRVFPMFHPSADSYVALNPSDGKYYKCSTSSLTIGDEVLPPTGYELIAPYSYSTAFGNYIWWLVEESITNTRYLAPASNISEINVLQGFEAFGFGATQRRGTTVGGFFVRSPSDWTAVSPTIDVEYIYWGPGELPAANFLVLQRDGLNYSIIEQEGYPIRIDISNNSPLLTVGSGDATFVSSYIYDSEVFQLSPATIISSGVVQDYRYTLLEPSISGVVTSGVALESTGLYVYGDGIYGFNTSSYSGGFTKMFDVPSGYGYRIETSNYGNNGQYIFIVASGDAGNEFFQKDPEAYLSVFDSYSGLPDSRVTMIRLDDRV